MADKYIRRNKFQGDLLVTWRYNKAASSVTRLACRLIEAIARSCRAACIVMARKTSAEWQNRLRARHLSTSYCHAQDIALVLIDSINSLHLCERASFIRRFVGHMAYIIISAFTETSAAMLNPISGRIALCSSGVTSRAEVHYRVRYERQ